MPEPTLQHQSALQRSRVLARLLDSAVGVPGTGMRIGLDPILGLVPGLGDLAGAAMSGYIVLTGIRLGVPRSVAVRMLANVAIDTAVGALPLLGDLFDAGWKSNLRNVALIERHVVQPDAARASSRLVLAAAVVVLLLLAASGIAVTLFVVRVLVRLAG